MHNTYSLIIAVSSTDIAGILFICLVCEAQSWELLVLIQDFIQPLSDVKYVMNTNNSRPRAFRMRLWGTNDCPPNP